MTPLPAERRKRDEPPGVAGALGPMALTVGGVGAAGLGFAANAAAHSLGYNPSFLPELDARVDAVTSAAGPVDVVTNYTRLGEMLARPTYGSATGLDAIKAIRSDGNLLGEISKAHPGLRDRWGDKPDFLGGLTFKDHYEGFAKGPVSALGSLAREAYPRDPAAVAAVTGPLSGKESLPQAEQLAAVRSALEANPAVADRLSWGKPEAAKSYRLLSRVVAAPGEAGEAAKRVSPWLIGGGLLAAGAGLYMLHRWIQAHKRKDKPVTATRPQAKAAWCFPGVGTVKRAEGDESGDPDDPLHGNPYMRGWAYRMIQRDIDAGKQRTLPRLFPSDATPLGETLASPSASAVGGGLLGAAAGAAAGGAGVNYLGAPPWAIGAGAAGGGLLGLLAGYTHRRNKNEVVQHQMRNLPPGATVGDAEFAEFAEQEAARAAQGG